MKHLRILLALVLTVTALTHSRPSQAAVGAIASGGVLIAGIAIAGGGTVVGIAMSSGCGSDSSGLCRGLTWLFMAPVIGIGLILLDGEQQVEFKELSSAEAAKLGISGTELEIYNSEVDQANMLVADVKTELSKLEKPSAQDSAAVWSTVKDLVSPATYATMVKIVSQK